ncbi:MAG TPA: DUF4157 domain-containing protein [Candidatus Kapabacteria bacterium]|nr:DUF4157 domain-containing protein [Candidatus Kapabacteria bacterium]
MRAFSSGEKRSEDISTSLPRRSAATAPAWGTDTDAAPASAGVHHRGHSVGSVEGSGGSINQVPVHSSAGARTFVQPKLQVSTPGDIYEQQADRVADRVTRMPETALQRACACGDSCLKCRGEQGIGERVQKAPAGTAGAGAMEAPQAVHDVIGSGGSPLDSGARRFMEPRMGRDFGGVRVHTDQRAASSAEAIGARAYTVGNNIVFGRGQYAPASSDGRRLLAHELTHVMQQSGGAPQTETSGLRSGKEHTSGSVNADGERTRPVKSLQRIFPLPSSVQRADWWWPLNGRVINNSNDPVQVWSDKKGFYFIAAKSASAHFGEDVDHVRSKDLKWYKVWIHNATVDENGKVHNYKCRVNNAGEDCPKKPIAD